jgi:hypothetical protein
MRSVSEEFFTENRKKHILCSIAVLEIMWKNIDKIGWPQRTI